MAELTRCVTAETSSFDTYLLCVFLVFSSGFAPLHSGYLAFSAFDFCTLFLSLNTAMAPKKICPFCSEEKSAQGYINHVKSCEKKANERQGALRYQQQLRDEAQAGAPETP